MTTTIRKNIKGIPPRLRDPKPKGKPAIKKNNKKMTWGSRKRVRSDSDDESGPDEDKNVLSDDSEPVHRDKKMDGKHRRVEHLESEEVEEMEVVEDNGRPSKDIEEVNDGVGEEQPPDEQEVSHYYLLQASLTHYTLEWWSQCHQHGAELQEKPVKKEMTLDLLTIMSPWSSRYLLLSMRWR